MLNGADALLLTQNETKKQDQISQMHSYEH